MEFERLANFNDADTVFTHNSGDRNFTTNYYYQGHYIGSVYGNRFTGRIIETKVATNRPKIKVKIVA